MLVNRLSHPVSATRGSGCTIARTSSENVTSRFSNHFFTIPSRSSCKICPNSSGVKLAWAVRRQGGENWKFVVKCSRRTVQLQNRSFHVMDWTRKPAELLFFIVKYAILRRSCRPLRRGCWSSLTIASLKKLSDPLASVSFLLSRACQRETVW